MSTERFYITTPIYYVNDKPHIGHAYTSIACDILARYQRLLGKEVFFLTGTDEHGQKVESSAAKAGIEPQNFVDANAERFRLLTRQMNLSNDDFIRTTEKRHVLAAQAIWKKLEERGHIYLGSYAGWYSVRDEAFYNESELVEGKAPTGAPVEWVEEPSYFFNLSRWQESLLEYYARHPEFIAPESRRNEVIKFVEGGLKDLSISRTSFRWGIPVPGDEKHIMYVWLDALVNYLTAAGYPDTESDSYRKWWPANIHMVGKDIVRFHAVYWPAFLMAADLPLPKRVVAHGWWTNEGQKISKSLGNVIDPVELVEQYGVDAIRYFLMREVPFGNDGNFSRDALIRRLNSELANNFGNLAQRSLSMVAKHCNAAVPSYSKPLDTDEQLLNKAYSLHGEKISPSFEKQEFHKVLEAIVELGNEANKYIDEQAPWTLRKTDIERMESVLYVLLEVQRILALTLFPFMPEKMSFWLDSLAVSQEKRNYTSLNRESALISGTALPEPRPLFPRYQEENHAG